MSVQAIVTPAGWLVEGEPCYWHNDDDPPNQSDAASEPDECDCGPPSVLTDAIGKPCENCDGRGRYQTTHARYDLEGNVESARFRNPNVAFDLYEEIEDGPWRSCEDCGGTGLASVELTVPWQPSLADRLAFHIWLYGDRQSTKNLGSELRAEVETRRRMYSDMYSDWQEHDDGLAVRVIPDKVLPVVAEHDYEPNVPAVEVTDQGLVLLHYSDEGAMKIDAIDIGPNPAQHVGKYLVTGVAVST